MLSHAYNIAFFLSWANAAVICPIQGLIPKICAEPKGVRPEAAYRLNVTLTRRTLERVPVCKQGTRRLHCLPVAHMRYE